MVTDTGGINDKSFNQSAWEGMQQAAAANPSVTVKYLQSTSQSDYVPNINHVPRREVRRHRHGRLR